MRATLLSAVLLLGMLSGCINNADSTTNSGIGDTTEEELTLPDWQIGDQWITLSSHLNLVKIALA